MIKKLSFLVAAVYSVIILSGCAMLDLGKVGVGENDPATQGEKVVARLHNHIRTNSLEAFDKYFAEGEDTEKMYSELTDITILENDLVIGLGDVSGYISQDKLDKWLERFCAKFYGASDYTIDNVSVNDGEVDVAVTMWLPDFSGLPEISDTDINAILEESFAFDTNDTDLFFSELAYRKGIDEAELRDIYSDSDESVWIADILELFSDEFDKVFNLVMDKLIEGCTMKDYKIYYTVEKQADDAWKITDVDND